MNYTITKKLLSIESGLASHEVFCGVQDSSGYLWFGTRNGLNRFDGNECLIFTRQRNGLQENKIVQLATDDANHIFLQYGSSGFQLTTISKVDVMNATTHEVKTLTATFPRLPFRESDVYWIANDGSGEVIFLTASPFRYWRYSSKTGFRLMYQMKGWRPDDSLVDHRSTGPLCTFIRGTAHLKLNNQQTQYLVTDKKVVAFRQNGALRSLPIGLSDRGELLITYNTDSDTDHFVVDKLTDDGRLIRLQNPDKHHLGQVGGRYWFQVWPAMGGGAAVFYIATDALYLWNGDAFMKVTSKSELRGFENLFIYRLFRDAQGGYWICTSSGVMHLTVRKNRFKPYFSAAQQSVEPNGQARGIYADGAGNVVANIWTHTFFQRGGTAQAISHPAIHYGLARHAGALFSGGIALSRYDENHKMFTDLRSLPPSEIWSLHSLNDSLLLVGSVGGLFIFHSNTGRFEPLPAPHAKFVYRFLQYEKDSVWAVAENGLFQLQGIQAGGSSKARVIRLRSAMLYRLSLLDAWRDADGIWWLATNGEGLYRWDPKKDSGTQYNITAGLPSDVLYRIEPDDFGNLWISSDYGLIRFNRTRHSVNTYTTAEGISHNEFNRTSSFRANDGKLYFGGLNGIMGFDPRDFLTDTTKMSVPLQITAFNQFVGSTNKLVNKTQELLKSGIVVLQPDDAFFTLDFQLLDFAMREGRHYAYKIEGLDPDWTFISENSVRISGLPYGEFTLRVKAQNAEGAWNGRELSIAVKVLKPFYLQWYFILGAIVSVVLLLYLLIRFRLRQLARDKGRLETIVEERTLQLKRSLAEQMSLLNEKDLLVKEIHHRVKNNLQVISGLLELQGKSLTDPLAKEALQEGRNRVRSIALIHQNLYQRDLTSIDLERFSRDLGVQVHNLFRKQQEICINVAICDIYLDIDSAVPFGLILNELLCNSFKYAFNNLAQGKINVAVSETAPGRYLLVYHDNGPGLPEQFNPQSATTLGLQLVNDLSRQIGGRVSYRTLNGAEFNIHFVSQQVRKIQD